MKQFPLVQVGNPNFRNSCSAFKDSDIISGNTKELIQRMIYTMRAVHGVGLAGPQVGDNRQFFVYRISPTKFRPNVRRVLPCAVFNPQIIEHSVETNSDWEGCFSVSRAGLFAKTDRATSIKVRYKNAHAEVIERELTGLEARIFQHEFDHLIGKVFLDRSPDRSSFMSQNEYRKMRSKRTS